MQFGMNSFTSRLFPQSAAVMLVAGLAAFTCAHAAEPLVLLSGEGVTVTSADLEADALNVPSHVRNHVMSNPAQLQRLAETIFMRRLTANRGVADGLDQSAVQKAKLQLARDTALSEMYMLELEAKNRPDDATAERAARLEYNGNKERFAAPAEKRARHILIKTETPDAKAKIDALHADLKKGANFAKLAVEHSQDTNSAVKGGDLGYFGPGKMVPEFDKTLAELKKGDFSAPFESRFGWHIVQLVDDRDAVQRPFEEVKETLMEEVRRKAWAGKREELTAEMRTKMQPHNDALEAYAAQVRKAYESEAAKAAQSAK